MAGLFSASYRLDIPGLQITDPGPYIQPIDGAWTATLRPLDAGFQLDIEITTDDSGQADDAPPEGGVPAS